ncbi:MAG: tetratricopeptide repeat protein [Gammaproteobacteria bacterium]|nr:tetratricopeptide repeat protein [Gammaproteobacteria bacterium]
MKLGNDLSVDSSAEAGSAGISAALSEIDALVRSGATAKALDRCRQHARANPDSLEINIALGRLEQRHGSPEQAIGAFENAAQSAPNRVDVWVALGDARLAGGRFEAAAEAYRQALALSPDSPELKARLGAALQSGGRVEEAAACYQAALKRSPQSALLHYNLGTALKALHRFDEAVTEYREAVRLAPDNPELKVRLGNLLVETSRFEQAIEPLSDALNALPREAQGFVCHLLAYAHKKLGQGEGSVAAAERLVALTGGAVAALMHLSAAYLTSGEPERALEVCERGLRREPASRQLLSDKALALSALGRDEEASRLYDFDRLLKVSRINAPPGYDSVDQFNAALISHIRNHPTLDFSGISLSCHQGATSDELLVAPKGPVAELEQAIQRAAESFRAELAREPAQPWKDNLPHHDSLELSAWVTRLRSQGYQHGHIHPSAWISGVYYVSLPPEVRQKKDDAAGWIEFGRAPYYYAIDNENNIRTIRPEEGMLVLFPSYFYHRTIPFDSDNERVTIAFDFRLPASQPSSIDGF